MNKSNNRKGSAKVFFKKNGFYIAIIVCVMAAAAISLGAVGKIMDNLTTDIPQGVSETDATGNEVEKKPEEDKPVPPAEEETPPAEELAESPAEETINAEPLIPIYTMPVASGMPVKGFSGGELVKNETMNDWRTHDGIDIETTEGAEVYAVYSGEILRAGEDPLWGYVVELKVDTGYTAVYANLTSDIRVKAGDRVSQGDLLGFVGTTAILENAEPPHLHFEVKSGEKYIDPASFY